MKKSLLIPMSSKKNPRFGCLGIVVLVVSLGVLWYTCLLSPALLQDALMGYTRPSQESTGCDCTKRLRGSSSTKLNSHHPKMSILLGVLTMGSKVERRNLLRVAYGVQRSNSAEVVLRFVLGKPRSEEEELAVGLEALHHGDIIILDCEENMNHGKSFTYFSTVATMGVHYDYVMKVDDDSYVRFDNLAKSLATQPRNDLYYGYVLPCENDNAYSWYMAGMGYVLSWDLVQWVHESPIPRINTDGTEDKLMGEWLNAGGKAKNRVNKKPLFYDHPEFGGKCSHELDPETILVHQVKNPKRWHQVLTFFERNRIGALIPPATGSQPP